MNDLPATVTDDQVAELPLSAGRAELVEEILRTAPASRRRSFGPWLAAGAAAAVVGGVALVPVLTGSTVPDRGPTDGPATQPGSATTAPISETPTVRSVPGGRYFALTAPGWTIDNVYEGDGYYEMRWVKGEMSFEADSYTDDQYDSYFEDRDREMTGTSVQLLGRSATTWAYDGQDHATMRAPEGGRFVELRGQGMQLSAYEDLLASLVQTDADGLAASIGEGAITPAEAPATVRALMRDVPTPDGFDRSSVRLSGFMSAYQASAEVAGVVGCAWLDAYAHGDRGGALAAFDGSTSWRLFQPMTGEGDYPEVFWAVADELRSGQAPAQIGRSIGDCGDLPLTEGLIDSPTYANPTAG